MGRDGAHERNEHTSTFDGLRRLARLERNLGALLVLTPLLLIAVDTDNGVRGSISAYYDVGESWAFYVPLTAGAMLFLVNGLIKNAHAYNTSLGLALLGVILFDHASLQVPHALCAGAFFVGNFVGKAQRIAAMRLAEDAPGKDHRAQ